MPEDVKQTLENWFTGGAASCRLWSDGKPIETPAEAAWMIWQCLRYGVVFNSKGRGLFAGDTGQIQLWVDPAEQGDLYEFPKQYEQELRIKQNAASNGNSRY